MSRIKTIMAGTAGLALTLAVAAPAAAQSYGYPQNNGGGVVGAIVNAVTGGGAYGQYPMGNYGYQQVSQRSLVQQCAVAAEQRLSGQYRGQGYGAYNGNGQRGYQNQSGARVLGITSVEQRPNGGLRVRGVATSGAYGQQGYGNQGYGNQGYGNRAVGQADLSFNCKVNSRAQVTDVTIARNNVRYVQPTNQGYNRGY